jgi:hypothetical protein
MAGPSAHYAIKEKAPTSKMRIRCEPKIPSSFLVATFSRLGGAFLFFSLLPF